MDNELELPNKRDATPTSLTEALEIESGQGRLQAALGPKFVVRRLLGRGGFAEVYEVSDVTLGRSLAAKILRADVAGADGVGERFLREARAAGQLRHPGIIPIYQTGGSGSSAFLLMPLINGESLAQMLERETVVTIAEGVRIVREIAGALSAAHDAGVVHRDIKPENILLEHAERRVVVTDFGIAKAIDGEVGSLTTSGVVIGTPYYMSPEQATGERSIDSRSDIYSLGILAYQAFTGELPFRGDTPRALLMHHVATEPANPRIRRPDLPEFVADAILKCLQKDPADRWASMKELAHALSPLSSPEGRYDARMSIAGSATSVVAASIALAAVAWRASGGDALTGPDWVLVGVPLLVGIGGGIRLRRRRTPKRPARPFEIPASFESGLFGGLMGGVVGGLVIGLIFMRELEAFRVYDPTGARGSIWLITQIVLATILSGAVYGASILLGVSAARTVGENAALVVRSALDLAGGVAGGAVGGAMTGIIVALVFAPRDLPAPSAPLLFGGVACIGLAVAAGSLLFEYRGNLARLSVPFLGGAVLTAFAAVLTVAFVPYETIVGHYWVPAPGRPLSPLGLSIGGILLGAVAGVMLGTQIGGTMAVHRGWAAAVAGRQRRAAARD